MPGLRRVFIGRGMRGRLIRGIPPGAVRGKLGLPLPVAQPKLAIGRNVFPSPDEELDEDPGTGGGGFSRGRPRGRWVRLGRGARPPLPFKKMGHSGGGESHSNEERPGLGFSGRPPVENARWKRWQQLSRRPGDDEAGGGDKTDDDDGGGDGGGVAGGGGGDLSRSMQGEHGRSRGKADSRSRSVASDRSKSPSSADADGAGGGRRVVVLTFENDEVGLLAGTTRDEKVLFHINQVWVNHPSAGFCPFREIYPTLDLSKQFYPGREVRCFKRKIPKSREATSQAWAVWLQGVPPDDELFRTAELAAELDFHLAEYASGRLRRLEMMVGVGQQRSLDATVQEYISQELGVAKLLPPGDNGVVLFHLDQVLSQGNFFSS